VCSPRRFRPRNRGHDRHDASGLVSGRFRERRKVVRFRADSRDHHQSAKDDERDREQQRKHARTGNAATLIEVQLEALTDAEETQQNEKRADADVNCAHIKLRDPPCPS